MNIIEAVKSGMPFRRKGLGWGWITKSPDKEGFWCPMSATKIALTRTEILHEDYEIQEPSVTITASQYGQAFNEAVREAKAPYNDAGSICRILARKLGLEGGNP